MKQQKRKARGPRPSLHSTGQWRVRFDGRAFYLGTDEDAAMEQFYELRRQWKAGTLPPRKKPKTVADLAAERAALTVRELVDRYHAHLRADRDDGWLARNEKEIEQATNLLDEMHGRDRANAYGPKRLKELQAHLCGLTRKDETTPRYTHKTVNEKVRRVVEVFRHAVSEELVPPSVLEALRAVQPLRRGKPGTRDSRKVSPVSREQVDAVLPYLSTPLAAAIELLWLTGARPSELLSLTPQIIDRDEMPWTAELAQHKTAGKGKTRTLFFGAEARRILEPLLLRPADAPLFSPVDGAADTNRRRRENRETPLWPSHERRYAREKAARPRQTFSDAYDARALHKALKRAIARCNRDREHKGLDPIEPWFTYQLRHSAGTRIRKEHGIEAARAVLGHTSAAMTEVYAEIDRAHAAQIAELTG